MELGAQRAKPAGWVSSSLSPDHARCPETHTEGSISPRGTGAASQPRSVRPCVSAHLPAVSPPFQPPPSLPPSTHPSLHPPTPLSIHLPSIHPPTHPSIHPLTHPFIQFTIHSSIRLSIHLPHPPSIYPPTLSPTHTLIHQLHPFIHPVSCVIIFPSPLPPALPPTFPFLVVELCIQSCCPPPFLVNFELQHGTQESYLLCCSLQASWERSNTLDHSSLRLP